MSENPIVSITGLNKWFGDFHVLRDINLEVAKGERIVVCGPSGSGKSTLIRCINALEEFQEGEIVVDGIELGPNLRRVDEVRLQARRKRRRLLTGGGGEIDAVTAFVELRKRPDEFFTPTSLVQLIVEIIEPYHGLIFDPACGSGGMFVQSARFVAEHKKSPTTELAIHGQEKVADTVKLCRMNLDIHGLEGDIRHGQQRPDGDGFEDARHLVNK